MISQIYQLKLEKYKETRELTYVLRIIKNMYSQYIKIPLEGHNSPSSGKLFLTLSVMYQG